MTVSTHASTSYVELWSLTIIISLAPRGKRIDWYKRDRRKCNKWLPYDARKPIETASFWAMVEDHENRRHEDGHRVQDVSIHCGPCVKVKAKTEEANDSDDHPAERHDTPTAFTTSEGPVEDDGDIPLRIMDADGSDHDEDMNDTRRTRRTRPRRPMTVTRISKIAKKKKRIRRTFTVQETAPAAKILPGLRTIDARLVLLFMLLFVFIYPRFGERNLFADLTCFILFIFFYIVCM